MIYLHMHNYELRLKCAMHEVQTAIECMKQEQTKHINPYKVFYQITPSFSSY
jgi:tryptophan 2,3-dioxygenase